ncbi:MAG: hypothetical protein ACXVJ7_10260 [Acidimicrobiia bacterium]
MVTTTDPDALLRRAHDLDVESWSDVRLVAHVADGIRRPRRDPADSFILHAPLELLARAALLPWVAPAGRARARLRLLALLDQYESWAPAGDSPDPVDVRSEATPNAGAADLAAALVSGDLEAADAAARAVARVTDPHDVTALLAPAVLPNLAAAAHAPIFLMHLPRVAPRGEATTELLRPLARELARNPGLELTWVRERPRARGSAAALDDALSQVPVLGIPGSTFIFPLMHQVDRTGTAAALLGPSAAGVPARDAMPVVLRHAARAMLLADPGHAPYGWTHCLTMSQAALAIAESGGDEQLAVDVAATYVVGFLAALAAGPVPRTVELPAVDGSFDDAVATDRLTAAAWALDAPTGALGDVWTTVATRASAQHDAHLVKYTLACRDAAVADPAAERLYLAAAASLLSFWESFVNPDDPLASLGPAGP